MSLSFDSDLSPRFPVPLAARLHAEHRARRASWRRLALPAPAAVVRPPSEPARAPRRADPNADRLWRFRAVLRDRGIVRIDAIVRVVVGEHDGISARDILGKSHRAPIVKARWMAMYLSRMAGYSFDRIGSEFGRDHATVMHGIQKFQTRLGADLNFCLRVVDLYIACGGHEG